MNKTTHGGARKGAGRKPPDSPKIRKNIYLTHAEWNHLAASPSQAIRRLIQKDKSK